MYIDGVDTVNREVQSLMARQIAAKAVLQGEVLVFDDEVEESE